MQARQGRGDGAWPASRGPTHPARHGGTHTAGMPNGVLPSRALQAWPWTEACSIVVRPLAAQEASYYSAPLKDPCHAACCRKGRTGRSREAKLGGPAATAAAAREPNAAPRPACHAATRVAQYSAASASGTAGESRSAARVCAHGHGPWRGVQQQQQQHGGNGSGRQKGGGRAWWVGGLGVCVCRGGWGARVGHGCVLAGSVQRPDTGTGADHRPHAYRYVCTGYNPVLPPRCLSSATAYHGSPLHPQGPRWCLP